MKYIGYLGERKMKHNFRFVGFFFVFALAFAVFLSSCQETIPEDRSPGLRGTDTDQNGLRDDIEKAISITFPVSEEKSAVEQKAHALQQFLEADSEEGLRSAIRELQKADACLYQRFSGEGNYERRSAIQSSLFRLTVNTPEKIRKYLALQKNLGGLYADDVDATGSCR